MERRWLTLKQVADTLATSTEQVRRLCVSGRLASRNIGCGSVRQCLRIDPNSLDQFLAANPPEDRLTEDEQAEYDALMARHRPSRRAASRIASMSSRK